MQWDFKEIFEPDRKKIALSFFILFLVLYFAPCKVTSIQGGNSAAYWSICSNVVTFPDLLMSGFGGMQFSFFGVLGLSDRMFLGASVFVIGLYAVSYAVSSFLVFYFKSRNAREESVRA